MKHQKIIYSSIIKQININKSILIIIDSANRYIQIDLMSHQEFDWYSLSKLDIDKPNVEAFANLIKNAHISQSLSDIPTSYRKKLLIMFQNCSEALRTKHQSTIQIKKELEYQKKVLCDKIQAKKYHVQCSLESINSQKMRINDKMKIVEKLKKKIITKKAKNETKMQTQKHQYYCPFCERDDFHSKELFTLHVFRDHNHPNPGQLDDLTGSQKVVHEELKDFLMTMKDKEFQIMEMVLNKHKEMQTQELQRIYQLELQKMKSQPDFYQRRKQMEKMSQNSIKSSANLTYEDNQQEGGQLKGQSQYLFYQQNLQKQEALTEKSLGSERYLEGVRAIRSSQRRIGSVRTKERDDYYDIFESQLVGISENESKYSENSAFFNQKPSSIPHQIQYLQPSHPTYNSKSRQQLVIRKSVISPNKSYQTIYSNVSKNTKSVHIFNSGPLMNDESGGSGEEDYFDGDHNTPNQLQDEQIRLNHSNNAEYEERCKMRGKLNIEQFERINFSNSKSHSNIMLEYSKDKSLLDASKEKSSEDIVDLSNSFSKRHMSYSKDDQTINLSDLRLSKLVHKNKKQQKEDVQYYNFDFSKVNGLGIGDTQSHHRGNILQQFERQVKAPQAQEQAIQQLKVGQIKQKRLIEMPGKSNLDRQLNNDKNTESVLEQFIRK